MIVTAIFKNQGTPATGLTPTIDIWDVAAGVKVISAAAMAEVGGGLYRYSFDAYDASKEYATVCDGGAGLNAVDRYATGGTTTEGKVDQILTDTNEIQGELANGGRVDNLIDGIKAKTDNLPTDPAYQSAVEAAITSAATAIRGAEGDTLQSLSGQMDGINTMVTGIKGKTDKLPADPASQSTVLSAVTSAEANIRGADGDSLKILSDQLDGNLSAVQSIQNNTSVRIDVPERLVRPDSGSKTYRIILGLYDTEGHPQTPDSVPTIQIENVSGVERLAETAFTQFSGQAGQYYYDLAISSSSALEVLVFRVKVVEGGVTTYHRRSSEVTEFEADLNEVQANVAAIKQKTDNMPVNTTSELTTIKTGLSGVQGSLDDPSTGLAAIKGAIDTVDWTANAIKAKTDKLPADTAAELDAIDGANVTINSLLTSASYGLNALKALIDALDTNAETAARFAEIKGSGWTNQTLEQINTLLSVVKTKTDKLPADTATELNDIDAANASISSLLNNATFGLNALKTLLDAIDTNEEAAARFAEIKGAGWTSETLVQLDSLLDTIKAKTDNLPVNTATELTGLNSAIESLDDHVAQVGSDLAADHGFIQALLENATFGLAALKTLLDTINGTTTDLIITQIDDIKGSGWTNQTLVELDSLLTAIKGKTDFMPADTAQELTDIDTQVAAVRERSDRLPDDPAGQSATQAALDAAESHLNADLDAIANTMAVNQSDSQNQTAELQAELTNLINAVQSDVTFIKDIEGGRWRIVEGQMVFYKDDNTTEIARFDLLNSVGVPSVVNVFERRRA